LRQDDLVNSSDVIDNGWTAFLLVGLVLAALGLLRGGVHWGKQRDAGGDPVPMNLPLVWAGVIVLGLGGVFGLAVAIARGNVVGIVLSVIQLATYAYIIYALVAIQRRRSSSAN
jgi:hypothetical protein